MLDKTAAQLEAECKAMSAAQTPRKIDGIGPTTKEGMPIVLRSVSDATLLYFF